MQKGIKFNGFTYKGSWICEDLSHNLLDETPCITQIGVMSGECVDPETIGQFTGLKDKTGKEIFEGNIINIINGDGDLISVVCGFNSFIRKINGNVVEITGFFLKLPNSKKTFPIVNNYAGKHDLELFEVIGNIHENDGKGEETCK